MVLAILFLIFVVGLVWDYEHHNPLKSCGSPFSGFVTILGLQEQMCLPCFQMLSSAHR